MSNIIREYPAKLIYNNGYWFIDLFDFGNIDLGDDEKWKKKI